MKTGKLATIWLLAILLSAAIVFALIQNKTAFASNVGAEAGVDTSEITAYYLSMGYLINKLS